MPISYQEILDTVDYGVIVQEYIDSQVEIGDEEPIGHSTGTDNRIDELFERT